MALPWVQDVPQIVAMAVGVGTLWRWGFAPLRRDVHDLRGEFKGLRGEFNDLRGEFNDLRGDVRDLQRTVARHGEEIHDLRRTVARQGEDVQEVKEEVHRLGAGLRYMGTQVRGVARALVPVLSHRHSGSADSVGSLLLTFDGTWSTGSGWEDERGNPLTQEELQRFKDYRVKFFERREALTVAEAADFHRMLDKMAEEDPPFPGLGELQVLCAILEGLAAEIERRWLTAQERVAEPACASAGGCR